MPNEELKVIIALRNLEMMLGLLLVANAIHAVRQALDEQTREFRKTQRGA